jgi:Uma2 family endonuclease
MIDAGILTEDDPVELLDGVLVRKMPKKRLHTFVTQKLLQWLSQRLPADYYTNAQEPVTLPTSEPEPDNSVIRGQLESFATRQPQAADAVLFVEVSETTLAQDRGPKKRIYARANIPRISPAVGPRRARRSDSRHRRQDDWEAAAGGAAAAV